MRGTTAVWQCSDHAGREQSFSVLVVSFYDWLVGWMFFFFGLKIHEILDNNNPRDV